MTDEQKQKMEAADYRQRNEAFKLGYEAGLNARDEEIEKLLEKISALDRAAVKYDPRYLSHGADHVLDSVVISLARLADLREALKKLEFGLQSPYKNGPVPSEIQWAALICREALEHTSKKDG